MGIAGADTVADPRLIGAAELVIGQTNLHIDRVRALERIQTLGNSSPLMTSLTVSSYQLAHPENLPAQNPNIFELDTELRRGTAAPVRVTITRENPSATASVPFSFDDITAGLRPEQPGFDYRVRYQDPDSAGAWRTGRRSSAANSGSPRRGDLTRPGSLARLCRGRRRRSE